MCQITCWTCRLFKKQKQKQKTLLWCYYHEVCQFASLHVGPIFIGQNQCWHPWHFHFPTSQLLTWTKKDPFLALQWKRRLFHLFWWGSAFLLQRVQGAAARFIFWRNATRCHAAAASQTIRPVNHLHSQPETELRPSSWSTWYTKPILYL